MSSSKCDVLVTGADQRQGLALIRALGAEARVFAAGPNRRSIGFKSRFAAASGCYPAPQTDKKQFAERVSELVREYQIPIVFPSGESEVIALDEHRNLLPAEVTLAIASHDSLSLALDKRRTYALAEALRIPCPKTCVPASISDAMAFARAVGFPVVLKRAAMPTYERSEKVRSIKVAYARDANALEAFLTEHETYGYLPLVQEYFSGIGVAQGCFCVDGELRAVYQYRRGRENPLTGGVSTVHVTEALDPVPLAWTRELLGQMRFDGLAQVEYRRNRESGRYMMIEVNGRCWAPISGALHAGLNFPLAYLRHLNGSSPLEIPATYPVGMRTRHLRGDLASLEHFFQRQTADYLEPLPSGRRLTWDVVKDFSPGVRGDIHRWGDLGPSLLESALLGRRYAGLSVRALRALWSR